MAVHQFRDSASALVVATGGITFPYWNETVAVVTGVAPYVMPIGGFTVIVLTIWKLAMEIKVANRKLRGDDR